jgi:hypothetical protein
MRTRYEWLDALSATSPVIKGLGVKNAVSDAVYKAAGTKSSVNADAFNLSNSDKHNQAVIDTIEQLSAKGAQPATLKKFITDLTSQNTYGTFAELSAYRFLLQGGHDFDIQAPMDGTSILNPRGADLDGILRLPEEIVFDIKGFGFLDYLVTRLTTRLSDDLAPDLAVAEDSWDVSTELLNDLLGKDYKALLNELKANRKATRDLMKFSVRAPQRVQVTQRESSPARAANENAEYPFRFAKQFARHKPFFLFFVIHPWFSGSLHVNFDGSLDQFTGEFAKQFFCQFESDKQMLFGLTRAEVARLLSGIVFVDAWELQQAAKKTKYRLFLNPNATNKPADASVVAFASPMEPTSL